MLLFTKIYIKISKRAIQCIKFYPFHPLQNIKDAKIPTKMSIDSTFNSKVMAQTSPASLRRQPRNVRKYNQESLCKIQLSLQMEHLLQTKIFLHSFSIEFEECRSLKFLLEAKELLLF